MKMRRYDTLILVAESPRARGVYEEPVQERREVLVTVKSVGMRESYEALSHGKRPEYVFELAQDFEYQGEKRAIYQGVPYDILRTYASDTDGMELVVERVMP